MPKEGANSEMSERGKGASADARMWVGANLGSGHVDDQHDRGQCLQGCFLGCRAQYKHAVLLCDPQKEDLTTG